MEKMTKRDYFNELKGLVADKADLVAFIDHELELLDKKKSSGTKTKTQIENEGYKAEILEFLQEQCSALTITDIKNGVESVSTFENQKISALLTQLIKEGKVVRTEIKKKAHFQSA